VVPETPEFVETEVVSSPVTRTFTCHHDRVLSGSVIVGFASISVYLIIYMPTFAVKNLDLPPVSRTPASSMGRCSGIGRRAYPAVAAWQSPNPTR
jgi:hypothetical protein